MKYRRYYKRGPNGPIGYVNPVKNLWLNTTRGGLWVYLIWPPVWGLLALTVYGLYTKGVI